VAPLPAPLPRIRDLRATLAARTGRNARRLDLTLLPMFERLIAEGAWWDCCDGVAGTAIAALPCDCIPPSIDTDDFFLRNGIGRASRERADAAPHEVRAFCREYRTRLAPLTLHEALKRIGPASMAATGPCGAIGFTTRSARRASS
jgi:3-methyladenine DNA glycosylase AlkD